MKLKHIFLLIIITVFTACDDCFLGIIGPCDEEQTITDDDGNIINSDLFSINVENTETIIPENKIKVRFKLLDDDNIGVPGKSDEDFNLFESVQNESEQLIDPLEAPRFIVPSPESYGYATMIVMDLSGSVINEIEDIKIASIDYVDNLFDAINSGSLSVGVYFFDGRVQLQEVIDFSNSRDDIIDAISNMDTSLQEEPQTALYHAVVQSCSLITNQVSLFNQNEAIKIFSTSVVVFSDGNNSNFQDIDRSQMNARINQTSANGTEFYAIGAGQTINSDVVNEIGRDAFFLIDNYSELNEGLNSVLEIITREANSNYELEICTAKRGIPVTYRLQVKGSQTFGGNGSYTTEQFSNMNECALSN